MNILLLAPTQREFRNISAAVAAHGSLRHRYTIVRCGIGKALAAASTGYEIARAPMPYDMIAVIGFAAATAGYASGDVVMPDTARHHDCIIPPDFIPELTDPYKLQGADCATVFTGDSFVNAEIIRQIKSRFGVAHGIFDMEITAVCQAADAFGKIPVVAVKFISDVPENGDTEFSYDAFADSHSDFSPLLSRIEAL